MLAGRDVRVMSKGGFRSERRLTVIERSAPGAIFWRFGKGRAFLGRMYWFVLDLELATYVLRSKDVQHRGTGSSWDLLHDLQVLL